ncbi:hypothetical protein Q0Z83_060170 [Actinoplanes sichuanensis]|uniref:DUF3168 domain-containing protein n=1 Tax=Actinoplanes sichuanensis TaxID=512349 RepID=A0ABW4A6Q1_9ACTN|nr:hypothetical protein [Actinoplanes sichuanensis]BEL07826.1 hypothetical protein Q0Z83_060170 [Actinoplanes sichuanensis]
MAYQLLPDLDAVLVAFLSGHAALVPLHEGRVGTRLAAGTDPAQRVTSLGGSPEWPWEDRQDFQIESWGGDQGQAKTLARTTEVCIYDLIGPVAGGHVRGLSVQLSQLWSPDDTTGRARYITQISCTCYPEGS